MTKLLIIDDEPDILTTTQWAFEIAGYEVSTAATGAEAIKTYHDIKPEVMLVDYKLPAMTGIDVLKETKQKNGDNVVAIMITGLTQNAAEIQSEAESIGVEDFLHKPLEMDKVMNLVAERLKELGQNN